MLRDLPIARQRLLAVLGLAAVLLFLAVRFVLHAGTAAPAASLPPVGTGPAATATAPAATALVVVDVAGAVRRPGLYRFRHGSRVADAVKRAGGATGHANLTAVNLAAPLADGEQVLVPARAGASGAAAVGAVGATAAGPLDLSSATLDQLEGLPGVGPVTAQKILDYRQQHGAFSSLGELDAISGIGPARIDQLKGLVVP